jgi:hypothetical protein
MTSANGGYNDSGEIDNGCLSGNRRHRRLLQQSALTFGVVFEALFERYSQFQGHLERSLKR